ncbi:MAG: DUF126 domain-containing protein [Actinomycetota bacterium]
MIRGRVLHPGDAAGTVLRLDEPLSFWGGLDPTTGTIIDQAHPQVGVSMTGAVVVMPGSRGSSGTPGVLGEALRRGVGPAALIVTKADVNLVAGAIVAEALYDAACPVVQVAETALSDLATGVDRVVRRDGTILGAADPPRSDDHERV